MAKILVDFDSTITMMAEHMLATCNAHHGTTYCHDDLTEWAMLEALPHSRYMWQHLWPSSYWQLDVPPQPAAIATLKEIVAAGHAPVIVTDRSPHMVTRAQAWLDQYGLSLPVIASHRETCLKCDVAEMLGLELAIEDAPHHALAIAGRGIPVYLMDKPYNRAIDCEHTECIARVRGGWQEIAELLGIEMIEVAA